jgi:cycloeucalenol cycloisomerase
LLLTLSMARSNTVFVLSTHPPTRAVERYWLGYTVVWGVFAAVVMLGGWAEQWRDAPLMAMGIGFAAGAMVPLWRPHDDERRLPWHERTATKMVTAVGGLALLMNYFCTPYFFEVLGMHFGFKSTINIQGNPVFLYLMTVAYFATYAVIVCAAYRQATRLAAPWRYPAMVLAPFAVAFLETALNTNPWMRNLFWFDDMTFMLWFGTISYGACFVFALPLWLHAPRLRLSRVFVALLAAMIGIVITFEVLRAVVVAVGLDHAVAIG